MGKNCSYSKCICDIPELNHKPNYKVGQLWKMYASMSIHPYYRVLMVEKHQLLCRDKDGRLVVMNKNIDGYANIGTPQLRTLVQEAMKES